MANNVPITPGSGADVATDQVLGGAHIQLVKLVDGTEDSTARIPGDATNGLKVNVTNGVVPVSDNGSSLTVDGSVGITGAVDVSGSAVDVSGSTVDAVISDGGGSVSVDDNGSSLSVDDGAGSLTVDSPQLPSALVGGRLDVAVGAALPAGSNAIGKLAANAGVTIGAVELAAAQTLAAVTAITNVVHVDDNGGTVSVDDGGGNLSIDDGGNVISVDDNGSSLTVDSTQLPSALVGGRLDVAVGAALPAGSNAIGKLAANSGVTIGAVELAASQTLATVTTITNPVTAAGGAAQGGSVTGNPVPLAAESVDHGAAPTNQASAAGKVVRPIANRDGVLFVIDGHPNAITNGQNFTGAQTDTALVSVNSGTKIVVTGIQVTVSNATLASPSVKIGFGTANVPSSGAGIVFWHPGIPAGGGAGRQGGILAIGADGEDIRLTCDAPTSGSISVVVTYYTIPA